MLVAYLKFNTNCVLLFMLIINHLIKEQRCLRITDFDVPRKAYRGNSYFLKCLFELEQDQLVNLKWYFNNKEFLRFEPKSAQETQIFQLPELNLQKSNVINQAYRGSIIRIEDLNESMSGLYRCEVTIEKRFHSFDQESYMKVLNQTSPSTTTTTAASSYSPTINYPHQIELKIKEREFIKNNKPPIQFNSCFFFILLSYLLLFRFY